MQQQNQEMAFNDARYLVANKKDYYMALERNGFKMPALKGAFLTSEVLVKIRTGSMYCIRYTDLVVRPCPCPPDTQTIRQELISLCLGNLHACDPKLKIQIEELVRQCQRACPDKEWMLLLIARFTDGKHRYFAKDYMPEPKSKKTAASYIQVDNSDGFFSGLPQSQS